jgi:hypothetical protein
MNWPEAFATVGSLAAVSLMIWAFMKYSGDDDCR